MDGWEVKGTEWESFKKTGFDIANAEISTPAAQLNTDDTTLVWYSGSENEVTTRTSASGKHGKSWVIERQNMEYFNLIYFSNIIHFYIIFTETLSNVSSCPEK
jgi:hypothetical protein